MTPDQIERARAIIRSVEHRKLLSATADAAEAIARNLRAAVVLIDVDASDKALTEVLGAARDAMQRLGDAAEAGLDLVALLD